MSARPLVTVQKTNRSVPLPRVFSSPLRYDLVQHVHDCMRKNRRMPYAVSRRAGHKTSAESWGTGRAVARIPRVSGGGTSRSGQGAFGNMCRGGRMFAPTKVFRKWTAKVNIKVRRMAVKAALAASAIPSLVLARGHNIARIPEIPLVVPNTVEALEKTKDAVKLLKDIGAYQDVEKVAKTKHIRAGRGKMRNRRHITRKGPLVVFTKKCSGVRAFRGLPGVDVNFVSALNLLRLAPGGHFGRLVIFSEDAFNQLDKKLNVRKIGHVPDSKRVLNSAEVQSVIRRRRTSKKGIRANARRAPLNPAQPLEAAMKKAARIKSRQVMSNSFERVKKSLQKKQARKVLKGKILGELNKYGGPKGTKEKAQPIALKPKKAAAKTYSEEEKAKHRAAKAVKKEAALKEKKEKRAAKLKAIKARGAKLGKSPISHHRPGHAIRKAKKAKA